MIIFVNGRLKFAEENLVFMPGNNLRAMLFIKTDFTPTLQQSEWWAG